MTKKKLDTKEVIGQTVEKLNEKMLFLKKEL